MNSEFDCINEEESTVAQRSEEEAIDIASSAGLVAFFPRDDEAFLDIDDTAYIPRNKVMDALNAAENMADRLAVVSSIVTTSKSGNKHVYVRFDRPLLLLERLVIQAVLGSDPVKEALTLLRVLAESTGAIALFETPDQAKRVERWRMAHE